MVDNLRLMDGPGGPERPSRTRKPKGSGGTRRARYPIGFRRSNFMIGEEALLFEGGLFKTGETVFLYCGILQGGKARGSFFNKGAHQVGNLSHSIFERDVEGDCSFFSVAAEKDLGPESTKARRVRRFCTTERRLIIVTRFSAPYLQSPNRVWRQWRGETGGERDVV